MALQLPIKRLPLLLQSCLKLANIVQHLGGGPSSVAPGVEARKRIQRVSGRGE
jgi:hypothetical protein